LTTASSFGWLKLLKGKSIYNTIAPVWQVCRVRKNTGVQDYLVPDYFVGATRWVALGYCDYESGNFEQGDPAGRPYEKTICLRGWRSRGDN
jgi:hypothetical protein